VELGLQPLLYHTANGMPLYAPFPLSVTIPAMMISHLLIFGFVDAVATGFLVSYVMRSDPSLLAPRVARSIPDIPPAGIGVPTASAESTPKASIFRWLAVLLVVLVVLVPLGLLAPGEAFAEYSVETLESLLGFSPSGLTNLEGVYSAPMSGYSLPGLTDLTFVSMAYILSAVVGVAVLGVILFGWYRKRLKDESPDDS
jgi:cobalt/nickel transport system permease protein